MSFKTLSLATALLAAPLVHGHYIFSQLIVNDEPVGTDYTYIRKNTNTYMPSYTADVVNSPDLICNQGAQNAAAETYEVKAGDKVGFKLWYNEFIEHPGPGFVYMSKAPGDVASYDGTGNWFKAYESGVTGSASEDTNWGTWQKDRIEFTIPQEIPDGDYLVRPEHIAIHEAHVGKAQFYMECAQLRVTGGGSGTPGPLVKIPGLYSAEDPGIAFNIWAGANTAEYVMPGPAVWQGGSSSSAMSSNSSASTGSTNTVFGSSTSTGATAGAANSAGSVVGTTSSQSGQGPSAPAWGSWNSRITRRSFTA